MKQSATLLLILFVSLKCFSQNTKPFIDSSKLEYLPIDSITHIVSFEEVVKVDSTVKEELFKRALFFFEKITAARLGDYALLNADEASGKLTGKGSYAASTGKGITLVPFKILFTISITVKNGRYRYELSNFTTDNDVNITDWYVNPKYRRSSGEMKPANKGYITNTSVIGQAISYLIKLRMEQPIVAENKDPRDNF